MERKKRKMTTEQALADAKKNADANIRAIEEKERNEAMNNEQQDSSVQVETEEAVEVTPKTNKKKSKGRRPSALDYAVIVLMREKGKALTVKEITDRVIAEGWNTQCKTPNVSLSVAMIREIAQKGEFSRFVKKSRGRYAIRYIDFGAERE